MGIFLKIGDCEGGIIIYSSKYGTERMWEIQAKCDREILRCVIPVVCLNYKERQISVKNTTIDMAKMMVFIAEQNKKYMFPPISAIIRFSQLLC